MLTYDPLGCLPSSEELPDSDDDPVDNELQDLIPGLLRAILALHWNDRWDWFFGVDMGVYYDPEIPPVVPDGFLSLGVERMIDEDLRPSYVLWEEQQLPILALEVVSRTYRGEYTTKKQLYAELGVLYYVVYSSRRRKKPPLEVYRLVEGTYQLLSGNPVWLPEIGLGIGRERATYQGMTREWLYWYDQTGQRYYTPEEQAAAERKRAEAAEQQLAKLRAQLRQQGIDPDSLDD
jgi:Uma2 family endonuclease